MSENMGEKNRHTLEFDKVLQLLADCASSQPGREACLKLEPAQNPEKARERLAETDDSYLELLRKGELPLSAFDDLSELLALLGAGSVPGPGAFLMVSRQLRLVQRLQPRALEDPSDERSTMSLCRQRIRALQPLKKLQERIDECVLSDEELKDDASPELFRLRRSIRLMQEEIRTQLDKVIRNNAGALQDQLVTLRSERYVIPVKAEQRSFVPGIVHDSSSSGATVFVEPMIVVELNNKIREARAAEREEIERILAELAALVSLDAAALAGNQKILTQLDLAQAKARLARRQKSNLPILNAEGRTLLKQARHPLIPAEQVVPIDLELGRSFDTLVITGPNTGGKTVSLKTCGLLTLMAMAGLFIPAEEGSEVSFFARVLADIGDEQSIEQNLSTFSAHLKQLIAICAEAGPSSLVLLDELGAGTDPTEGAALAIAILDFLRRAGCHTVATTHYQELKGYALNSPGVSNACCEFDNISLRPTYRLLIGVPGVSNALAISQRLGLPTEIIDAARALISDEGARFEELVSAIERSHQEAARMKEEVALLKAEAEKAGHELEEEKKRIEAERVRLIREAKAEAYQVLSKAEEEAENILRSLRQDGALGKDSEAKKKVLNEAAAALAREMGEEKLRAGIDRPLRAEDLALGAFYEDLLSGFSGQLAEMPDSRGQLLLKNGNISLRVALRHLRPAEEKREKQKKEPLRSRSSQQPGRRAFTRSELYLLGKTVAEALNEVDQYLDDAELSGLEYVRIVHGKGSGALRKAIREKLNGDARVRSYDDAPFGEGDAGVTVAKIR